MAQRKKQDSFFRRNLRTILGVAVLALAIHDLLGSHGFLAMRRTQQEIRQLDAEMQQLNRDNQSLSDEVTSLKTDPRLIERIAREDMGLARPGEIIVKLPSQTEDGKPPAQGPTPKKPH